MMLRHARFKNAKDIETAAETLIDSFTYMGSCANHPMKTGKENMSITAQQLDNTSFDNDTEKRSRK